MLVKHKAAEYYQYHQCNQTEKTVHQNAKNINGLAYTRQYKCYAHPRKA